MILVCGGSGYIGSHLCLKLHEASHAFIGTYCKNKKENLRKADFYKNITSEINGNQFHTAIYAIKINETRKNITSFKNFIEYAKVKSIENIIFISSGTVYQIHRSPISEKEIDYKKQPEEYIKEIAHYNRECESLLYKSQKHFKKTVILRPSLVYGGRHEDSYQNNIIRTICLNALNKKNVKVLQGQNVTRDLLLIDDLIKCILKCTQDKSILHETFNISTGQEININEISKKIAKLTSATIKNQISEPFQSYRVLKNTRAVEVLKIKFTESEEGIKKYLEFLRNKYNCM